LTWRSDSKYSSVVRQPSLYKPLDTYALEKEKHYQQQFADIYFLRLTKLKPIVEQNAREAWDGFQIAEETVEQVERVLDVRQGKLCWVVGTIYMDMPLKPNILDDISKDVSYCTTGICSRWINIGYSTGFRHHRCDKSICRRLERI
jgi:DNA polymerase delta subunit 2